MIILLLIENLVYLLLDIHYPFCILGYFYWHIVAEKLGLNAECRAWEGVDNPTEKLLSAYGETEGSTVRNLIKALREAGLTLFANEIEQLVSTTQGQDDAERIEEIDV